MPENTFNTAFKKLKTTELANLYFTLYFIKNVHCFISIVFFDLGLEYAKLFYNVSLEICSNILVIVCANLAAFKEDSDCAKNCFHSFLNFRIFWIICSLQTAKSPHISKVMIISVA